MNRTLLAALSLSLLSACGMKEEKFREQFIEASCESLMECSGDDETLLFFDNVDDCKTLLSLFWGDTVADCEYDAKLAKECMKAIDPGECQAEMPAACDDVYTGDSCLWGGSSGGSGGSGDTGW